MRFKKIIFFLFFIFSCDPQQLNINQKVPYSATGFAYIYNLNDYNSKIIKGKMNNEIMQISHQKLKTGALIKITNPKNKESIVLKNIKRIRYPDFYKILITESVANQLNLNVNLPIIEVTEIKKNRSFVAKKAKIFNEEKTIPSNAPVASVQISNISKNNTNNIKEISDEIFIHIGTFYSLNTAKYLKERINKELPTLNKKIKVKKINTKKTQVILGPYISVNLLKNDYIKLKNFGFEELDIFINE